MRVKYKRVVTKIEKNFFRIFELGRNLSEGQMGEAMAKLYRPEETLELILIRAS